MVRLVIVESPAKAKTIAGYLGAGYRVQASMGHVRDLPQRSLGVDVERAFTPTYEVMADKAATVRTLRSLTASAEAVYLATDPDREGEAIAWHLVEALGLRGRPTHRVEFHSLTPAAVSAAIASPRSINQALVDAQQARRVLDRLVGYKMSPLLWRKVRRGLSAGRVQSVAVRLLVDRERAIGAFVPREYWSITGHFTRTTGPARDRRQFAARLHAYRGAPADLPDETAAHAVLAALDGATYTVSAASTTAQQRRPAPPFTTSTLQQEAARKLNMAAKTCMSIAQQLYEGVALAGAREGLITYMRTDSLSVAPEAQARARAVAVERWGDRAVPARPPVYRARTKGAQEAHEAIRPTDPRRDPAELRAHLTAPQFRLYRLIWQRFIASQMSPALLDVTSVDISARAPTASEHDAVTAVFRASGSVIVDPGFLNVYREGTDEDDDGLDEARLPKLTAGDPLALVALTPEQHFTKPPPRFTEASLVKALEEAGIGRPSTYASIMSTIVDRGYVERRDKQLAPTELGVAVTDLLVRHFPEVLDPGFTAAVEARLDDVAAGAQSWTPVVRDFYLPFSEAVARAAATAERVRVAAPETGETCPRCGQSLVRRTGPHGAFIACSGFPACDYTRSVTATTGVPCPRCRSGELVERTTRATRQKFWGCSRYPECDHVERYQPLTATCGQCGGHLSRAGRGRPRCIACQGAPPVAKRRAASPSGVGAADPPRRAPRVGSPRRRRRPPG